MSSMGLEGPHADTTLGLGAAPPGAERPPGDPAGIAAAAAALTAVAASADNLGVRIGTMTGQVRAGWQGTAGAGFEAQQGEAQRWAGRVSNFAKDIPAPLTTYSTVLRDQQAAWDAAFAEWQQATQAAMAAGPPTQAPGEAPEAFAQRLSAGNAAELAATSALLRMQQANQAALAASDAAAAQITDDAGTGATQDQLDDTNFISKMVGYGLDGNWEAVAKGAEKLGTGKVPGLGGLSAGTSIGMGGINAATDWFKKDNENLTNDLMSESSAHDEASQDTIRGAGAGVLFGMLPGGVIVKSTADFVGGNVIDDMLESSQDAPTSNPTSIDNPYSVSGETPVHQVYNPPTLTQPYGSAGPAYADPAEDAHPYGPGTDGVPN